MTAQSFQIASSVGEALDALAEGARPIAGGTDLVVGHRHGKAPLPDRLVAIDRLAGELGRVERHDDGSVSIGALVTHAELMTNPVVIDAAAGLADAAALVGSPATRHLGTVGGNLMNASPAMDTGAPLVALDATVTLASAKRGERTLALTELWSGPGVTTAADDELLLSVRIPPAVNGASGYVRLEYRRAMEIAVVGAGASLCLAADGQTLTGLSVALSAVGPTILSVPQVQGLVGSRLDDTALATVASAAAEAASPMDDLRASADYRRHTVGVMARRCVEAAARRARGEKLAVPLNRSTGIGAP